MPYDELTKWFEFFNRRPVGWRDDQRAYMLLRAQGVKEHPETIFPALKQIHNHEQSKLEDDKALPKGKILDLMLKAKGGDGSWKPNFKDGK